MNLSRGLLRTVLFVGTSVLGAAAGCVGDDPEGGAAPDASTSGASSSGASSSSSGATDLDAALLPDVAPPVIAFCAAQPVATLKFCEDFENTGSTLGAWTAAPTVPAGSSVALAPDPDRGKILYFDVGASDAGAQNLFVAKTLPVVNPPYAIEYDVRVNEHAPASPGAPFNGFISTLVNGAGVLLFGVAQGEEGVGGGNLGRDGGRRGPDRLNPYTSATVNEEGQVRGVPFDTWIHVLVTVSVTGDTRVYFQGDPVVERAGPPLSNLSELGIGFQRGASDRWTLFYDNVLVRSVPL